MTVVSKPVRSFNISWFSVDVLYEHYVMAVIQNSSNHSYTVKEKCNIRKG